MSSTKLAALALAAASLLAVPLAYAEPPAQEVTNGPQASPGDHSPRWSATRNVHESMQYEHLLHSNRAFRMSRMKKECGPINDPALHSSCLATFNGDQAMSGSSMPPKPIRNSMGGND
ncbi:MAG TPA: hypothetical protein VFW46_05820 [Stellaceae bacterium]|nr:hypothetical protein [Stellaceae bacterium]